MCMNEQDKQARCVKTVENIRKLCIKNLSTSFWRRGVVANVLDSDFVVMDPPPENKENVKCPKKTQIIFYFECVWIALFNRK